METSSVYLNVNTLETSSTGVKGSCPTTRRGIDDSGSVLGYSKVSLDLSSKKHGNALPEQSTVSPGQ